MNRRDFLLGLAAIGCESLWGKAKDAVVPPRVLRVKDAPEIGAPLAGWKPGEMDIHFIYTGCGENAFYILPDGTTWLNDCGDAPCKGLPRLPDDTRSGAEWVCRYVSRLVPSKELDYVTVSHWHPDHVLGLDAVFRTFRVRRFLDHQFPNRGTHFTHPALRKLMDDAVRIVDKAVKEQGTEILPFRVGALNQFRLQHGDVPWTYCNMFTSRNICANGLIWTGKGEEAFDFAAQHERATGATEINQNTLSMGLRLDYGKFSFFTGGDVVGELTGAAGEAINYEATVGRRCGPVTLCKSNHHASPEAMTPGFVRAVRAAVYVTHLKWPKNLTDVNMRTMCGRATYPGERLVFPTAIPDEARRVYSNCFWWPELPTKTGHVVDRVAPGGERYRVYVVDARDERGTVLSVAEGIC